MNQCRLLSGTLLLAAVACQRPPTLNSPVARHSSSLALNVAGTQLYVANADTDSVSVIDTQTETLETEILLNGAHPVVSPDTGTYLPLVLPRAVALSPHANRLYVTGERSDSLHVIDLGSNKVTDTVKVCAEPVGVLVSPDEESVYVACSNDSEVVRVDTSSLSIVATVQTWRKPWALAWSGDTSAIYVTHLLASDNPTAANSAVNPAVTVLTPVSLAIQTTWKIVDRPPLSDPRLSYGQARGLYDIVPRPGTSEVWIPHLSLANQTQQLPADAPTLDFETTAFPTLSIFNTSGLFQTYLSTDAQDVPGINGAFGDVVSGPHQIAFTSDGHYALVVDTNSEDVLVVDAVNRVESSLVRPLPGHMQEGIVLSPDGTHAYVDERNSGDVAVLDVNTTVSPPVVTVEPNVIALFGADPMPATMRLGQHIFFTANSDQLPVTQNHWLSCSSCHIEGRSDAVTWEFSVGPRDTPSNAGGLLNTGFLLHTADRSTVQDYWHVINIEMGGSFTPSDPTQASQLDALATFLNYALPVPMPPTTLNGQQVDAGYYVFNNPMSECIDCHYGVMKTDSGAGNPSLNLDAGPILLHNVGTCNTGPYPDVPHTADNGAPRLPCWFDTAALRGLDDSAPYFHDGSATTLNDVLAKGMVPGDGGMGNTSWMTQEQQDDLVAYLRSL